MNQAKNIPLGVVLMMIFTIVGPVIDVFGKFAAQGIPVGEIVFARFSVQSLLLLPVCLIFGWAHLPSRSEIARHFARAALILFATACFFAAIRHMPIADAMAIFFVEPFILTLLGGAILGEAVGWRRLVACTIGFGGALFVIKPSFAIFGATALLPLGTAVAFAFYMILTRQMAQKMQPVTLQAYTAVAAVIIMAPILWVFNGTGVEPLDPVVPSYYYVKMLIGVGIAATIAHIFISFALKFAPAASIAPLQYFEIVAATIFGFYFFDDLPDQWTVVGVTIIVSSGLYVFFRERRLAQSPAQVSPPP
jgi:drug/metabolite transporter (DMT)-like permease